ncbi:hypothetical protein BSPWISOXPB_244 [uncultured Gammaproteobacteria bacterium]|nr:hypothetical protein BSPWISOXPB_244 [uncultured Gammaproteobacteria bacterium]
MVYGTQLKDITGKVKMVWVTAEKQKTALKHWAVEVLMR